MILSGCSERLRNAPVYFELSRAEGDLSRVDLALEQTVHAFVGPVGKPRPDGNPLVGEIPADLITNRSSGTTLEIGARQTNALTLGYVVPIRRGVDATFRLSLAHGDSDYALPDGAGILTDPIAVAFTSDAASVETRIGWQVLAGRRYSPRLIAGGGAVVHRTTTRINSALLAVRHKSTHSDGFVTLGLEQPLYVPRKRGALPQVVLDGQARIYTADRFAWVVGVQLRY